MPVARTASNLSDYGARQALKIAFGLAPDPPPAHLWVALSSTPIQRDGSNLTEPPSSAGYARAQIPAWTGPRTGGPDGYSAGAFFLNSGTAFAAAHAPGVAFQPSADVVFPQATSTWNLYGNPAFPWLYMGIYDAPTGGHLIWRLWEEEPSAGGPVDGAGHSVSPGFPDPPPGKGYTASANTVAAGDTLVLSKDLFWVGFANVAQDGSDTWNFVSATGASVTYPALQVPVLKHMLGISAFGSPSWEVGLVHSDSFSATSEQLPPFFEPGDPSYSRKPLGAVTGPTGNRTDLPGTAAPYVEGGGWSWFIGPGAAGFYQDCQVMMFDAAGNWAWLIGSGNTGIPNDGDTISQGAASVRFQAW